MIIIIESGRNWHILHKADMYYTSIFRKSKFDIRDLNIDESKSLKGYLHVHVLLQWGIWRGGGNRPSFPPPKKKI